jgi:hypothetical protein
MKRLAFIPLLACFIISVGGCCAGKVRLSASASNDTIRSHLLAHTPIGSDCTNVLSFVVSRLCSHNVAIRGYASYLDAIPVAALRGVKLAQEPKTKERCIEVSKYPAGLTAKQITVTWMFDTNNMLTNIVVNQMIWSL